MPVQVRPSAPFFIIIVALFNDHAGVAELADAHDSKSCSSRSAGSTPATGIYIIGSKYDEINVSYTL